MKSYADALRDANGATVRCDARPWSDWCQRGKPDLSLPGTRRSTVCAACHGEGYTAPEPVTTSGTFHEGGS